MGGLPLVAVDVGNSRTKLGQFVALAAGSSLPVPLATLDLSSDWSPDSLATWITANPANSWRIASVNRSAAARLMESLLALRSAADVHQITYTDLPIEIRLPRPERVGVDRLLGAVAANHLRRPDKPAIVVDVGTAITVDLVTGDGAFAGGAILPGIALAARALHEQTDALPHIDMAELASPQPTLGTSTETAIRSGLFWGALGAIRELVDRLEKEAGGDADVFFTGGAAANFARLVRDTARHEPHLVLAGIALSCVSRD